MAHKKAGGSSRNGRDSNPKMLGVKLFGGEAVSGGLCLQPPIPLRASPPDSLR